MANRTRVPVAGAGTCLKLQTNWAPAPTPAQAGTRAAGTQVDRYLLRVRVPVPNLARNGHPHPHQAPSGGYLSTFTGTCWPWVPGTRKQVPVCHLYYSHWEDEEIYHG
ncbi:hypothetical protein PCANC_17799 [Puccinia coronata f. sp. avenae]|uniref:Uncharacterized protein n=1 Tax=Puccinia coronata f. sp. avenae TaxID=200324 RepID=A0A2N5SI94_9BASI|nr:hypothetical protein PCANC_17799 [Puccinia coronata f. sp. avenae]